MVNSICNIKNYNPLTVNGMVYDIRWGKRDVINDSDSEQPEYVSFTLERFFHKPSLYELKKLFSDAGIYPTAKEARELASGLGYSENEILPWLKDILIANIKLYDKSTSVNDFTIGDVHLWLDGDLRDKVKENLESCENEGLSSTVLRFNGMSFPLTIEQGWAMYYAVLKYARECWDVTENHLETVMKMTNISELISYDYTTGYPVKLAF